MNPVILDVISNVCSRLWIWMQENEIQDVYFHVLCSFVIRAVEVWRYVTVSVISLYDPKVSLEPIHQASFGLSDVLFGAFVACDAINEIVTLACDIVFGHVFSSSVGALDPSCGVQFGAVSAI